MTFLNYCTLYQNKIYFILENHVQSKDSEESKDVKNHILANRRTYETHRVPPNNGKIPGPRQMAEMALDERFDDAAFSTEGATTRENHDMSF